MATRFTIDSQRFYKLATVDDNGAAHIEASTLGLAPGEWPDVIVLTSDVGDEPLTHQGIVEPTHECTHMYSGSGEPVYVFND